MQMAMSVNEAKANFSRMLSEVESGLTLFATLLSLLLLKCVADAERQIANAKGGVK